MMKYKLIAWLSLVVMIGFVSCKKDELSSITSFTASQGTRIGVVRLTIGNIPDATNYEIERKNPATNEFESIYSGASFVTDDCGWLLSGEKLIPGQVYEYRARAHSDETGHNNWTESVTGYSFSPMPEITSMNYELIAGTTNYSMSYVILDKLPEGIGNLRFRDVILYRSENTNFEELLSLRVEGTTIDSLITGSKQEDYDINATYNYKFEITYGYNYSGSSATGEFLFDGHYNEYIFESGTISGDDITN